MPTLKKLICLVFRVRLLTFACFEGAEGPHPAAASANCSRRLSLQGPTCRDGPSEAKKKTCTKKRQNCATQKEVKNIKEQTLRDAQTAEEICFLPVSSGHMARCLTILPHNNTKDCSIPCFILHLLRDFYTTLHILHYDYYIVFSSNCSTCCLQSLQFIHCNRVNRSSGFAHV